MSEILQVADKKKIKQTADICIDSSDDNVDTEPNIDDGNDSDYEPPSSVTSLAVHSSKVDLTEIVETQSRFSFSHRGTAEIVNATLKAFQIPVIIDKSKLQRAQKRTFASMNETDETCLKFGGGLYYDSRKDETITRTKKLDENGKFKFYRTVSRQEHYSLGLNQMEYS